MIVVKLWGGLGNQLFQYSYGYQLAKKIGTEMKLDISYYSKQNLRQPIILKFNLEYSEIITAEELPLTVRFLNMKNPNRIIRIPSYFCFPIGKGFKYLKETRFRFDKKLLNFENDNIYLDGYWQCPRYIENNRLQLIEQFQQKDGLSLEIQELIQSVKKETSIAIHVRRGDYVNNNNPFSRLALMDKIYYDEAIKMVKSKFKDPVFYFFTNDVDWVKDNYGYLPNSSIVSDIITCKDVEELFIMSQCKHQIISNSTFSWWGAWLNTNEEKQVWTPNNGFGNNNIIPENWNIITQ
jgi:hypothetical protein